MPQFTPPAATAVDFTTALFTPPGSTGVDFTMGEATPPVGPLVSSPMATNGSGVLTPGTLTSDETLPSAANYLEVALIHPTLGTLYAACVPQ